MISLIASITLEIHSFTEASMLKLSERAHWMRLASESVQRHHLTAAIAKVRIRYCFHSFIHYDVYMRSAAIKASPRLFLVSCIVSSEDKKIQDINNAVGQCRLTAKTVKTTSTLRASVSRLQSTNESDRK